MDDISAVQPSIVRLVSFINRNSDRATRIASIFVPHYKEETGFIRPRGPLIKELIASFQAIGHNLTDSDVSIPLSAFYLKIVGCSC